MGLAELPSTHKALQQVPKKLFINRHKESYQIATEHPGWYMVVIADATHTFGCILYCSFGTVPFSTVKAYVPLLSESQFKQRLQAQADPMMYDTITKACSKHLAPFRVFHKKAGRRAWMISSSPQFVGQNGDIIGSYLHIFYSLFATRLTPQTIAVGFPNRVDEILWHFIISECCHRANNVTVILVVVVRVTIGEVHVTRVVAVVLRNTPVVTAFFRLCNFVTERSLSASRSKTAIQRIIYCSYHR